MLRFYSWLKQILKKMDNNLNWDEIKSIMGQWIRKKLSGKPIIYSPVCTHVKCLNSFSIVRRTRDSEAQ